MVWESSGLMVVESTVTVTWISFVKKYYVVCVKRSITVPYMPQQNPYAERTWGDLLRKIRS